MACQCPTTPVVREGDGPVHIIRTREFRATRFSITHVSETARPETKPVQLSDEGEFGRIYQRLLSAPILPSGRGGTARQIQVFGFPTRGTLAGQSLGAVLDSVEHVV